VALNTETLVSYHL